MRGPGVRLDLDVRRVWRCPACQRERRLAGDHTAVRCSCPAGAWMQIVSERVPIQRPMTSAEARELTVASFNLTEEELAKPLPGRVRRRGPGPRTESPPADAPPESSANPPERGGKEPRGRHGGPPNAERPERKPRPPRPPKGTKRPLSDIANLPDAPSPTHSEPTSGPPPESPMVDDDFSAGIDLPSSPTEG